MDNGIRANAPTAIQNTFQNQIEVCVRQMDEVRLILGNALASLRGRHPETGSNAVPPKPESAMSKMQDLRGLIEQCSAMATELRDNIGE